MGQALAFAPNFGAAVSAAGRVMTLLARKPRVGDTDSPGVPVDYVSAMKFLYSNNISNRSHVSLLDVFYNLIRFFVVIA